MGSLATQSSLSISPASLCSLPQPFVALVPKGGIREGTRAAAKIHVSDEFLCSSVSREHQGPDISYVPDKPGGDRRLERHGSVFSVMEMKNSQIPYGRNTEGPIILPPLL